MTEFDLLCLSLGVNIGLLVVHYRLNKKYDMLSDIFSKLLRVMEGIADGKATAHRDSKGQIRVKDLRHETN